MLPMLSCLTPHSGQLWETAMGKPGVGVARGRGGCGMASPPRLVISVDYGVEALLK